MGGEYDCEHGHSCYTCKDCEIAELRAEVWRLRKESAKFIDDLDREYNRKTNRLIARHAHQLEVVTAECNRYREALERISILNPWSDVAREALRGGEV